MIDTWNNIRFITDDDGNVIGDYRLGNKPYGFIHGDKPISFEDVDSDVKDVLTNLVYLFFSAADNNFHDGYEYAQIDEYIIYREVEQYTFYKDLLYKPQPLQDGQFLYLTFGGKGENDEEFYIITVNDKGLSDALVSHYMRNYVSVVDVALLEPESPEEHSYWAKSTTVV